jgi:hypothetical protein
MTGCPDRWSGWIPVGTPDSRGVGNVQKRGFCQKPPKLAKNAKFAKMAKNAHFRENPKNDQKTVFFPGVQKCLHGGTNMR